MGKENDPEDNPVENPAYLAKSVKFKPPRQIGKYNFIASDAEIPFEGRVIQVMVFCDDTGKYVGVPLKKTKWSSLGEVDYFVFPEDTENAIRFDETFDVLAEGRSHQMSTVKLPTDEVVYDASVMGEIVRLEAIYNRICSYAGSRSIIDVVRSTERVAKKMVALGYKFEGHYVKDEIVDDDEIDF